MDNKVTRVKDHSQIPLILHLIHDCWFDVSNISYRPEESLLTIKFERELLDKGTLTHTSIFVKRVRVLTVECFLHFYHVNKFTINDTEKVGRYDLVSIDYQADTKKVLIKTGVPIDIILEVKQFEIAVEETDKVISARTRCSLFGM